MLSNFSTKQKIGALLIASIFILGFIFIFASAVRFAVNQFTSKPTPQDPLQVTFCDATPEGICILSFGRDVAGETLINLFVTPNTLPEFYMQVNKTSGTVVYACEKNEDVESSVYCVGEAVQLGEQVEIILISKDGDIPIATGKFIVTAILVLPQGQDSKSPPTQTGTPDSAIEPNTTPVSYP